MARGWYRSGRSAERLRRLYPGGRAGAAALRAARLWNRLIGTRLLPRRWVSLEVRGRRSGLPLRFPLGMADLAGRWYLVSMLGECNWTANVRAAGGRAVLHGRIRGPVRLSEVPVADRPPVLLRYVATVPGGRPHLPAMATPDEVRAASMSHPVFLVERA